MGQILDSIAPIFIIILLGFLLKRWGVLTASFTREANRVAFQIGVPALVFREVARADVRLSLHAADLLLALASVLLVWAAAWLASGWAGLPRGQRGTFLQAAVHGNISYIGLAMVLYTMGAEGLQRVGVLAGFLILLNNSLAAFSLHRWGVGGRRAAASGSLRLVLNPVVIASLLGITASLASLRLPAFADSTLRILGQMALPTALLVMGSDLSFREMAEDLPRAAGAACFKMLLLPGTGWALLTLFRVPAAYAHPTLLLLAAPSAALTYVMAREMGGDQRLASSAVGLTTLLSALTYLFWMRAFL